MERRETTDKPTNPLYPIPVKCAVCKKCWFRPDAKNPHCLYGGPFSGYQEENLDS